ncbi:APC family permease [Dictyobacter arantiisoli]|uniref:Amino acid permease n=1 Tax=Dictyobacter arantiisoli TaxID=2014874 RepID=A0A5A5T889_9CHLR|nr:APC family permease [Dictyobacter arantiisoli]GCF07189.1 amino acid permease [Dictyobacter arantiisoli]
MQIPLASKGKITGLRTNALAYPAVLAQSIALISPTMTAVLIIPLTFASAGPSAWLAYLFATLMLLFVVFNLNQFARRSSSPGSMYAYIGRGLGARGGVLSGWALLWAYLFIGIAGMNGFAIFSTQLLAALGFTGNVPPIFFFGLSGLLCWYLAYKDIRISAMLTLILEGLSVLCILALAIFVLFGHGFSVDSAQISLKGISLPGMSLAVVACIFSLVGFESATALGGEAQNPLRSIPRAVIWSLILTGLFFVLMSYIEVAGVRGYKTTLDQISAPLNVLADFYNVNFFKIPLSIGAMISFFSLSLSCLNAGARILLPMARHAVFPASIGKTHTTNQTPHIAVTVYAIIMVLVPIAFSLFTDTLTSFNDAGTLAAFGFLLAYFLISIAAPLYLRRIKELRTIHSILAILAIICLLVPTIGSLYPVPAYPINLFPYIFIAYMLIGAIWLYLASRRTHTLFQEIEEDLEDLLQHIPTSEEATPALSETIAIE